MGDAPQLFMGERKRKQGMARRTDGVNGMSEGVTETPREARTDVLSFLEEAA